MSEQAPKTWSGPNNTGRTQVNRVTKMSRRVLTVSRIEDITPGYRRVYLTGEDLNEGFPWVHLAVSDHVKVLFPPAGSREVTIPERGPGGWILPEGSAPPVMRDYTVRRWLPETRELVFDFVVHEHGIAGRWARQAQAGDQLGVLGPRGNVIFPENYAHYVLIGDETALPSIQRFIEELPAEATIEVIAQAGNPAEIQELGDRPGLTVTWLDRSTGSAGNLAAAVQRLDLPEGDDWFVFAAGEVGELKPVRDWFRVGKSLPKERVMVSGYWQKGVNDFDHHNTGIED